jgi:hypothetical protein
MERLGFRPFCGTHGLRLEGRLFLMGFRAKGLIWRWLPGFLSRRSVLGKGTRLSNDAAA